ncbi:MAG: hypothetical protein AAF846_04415 [Chloroflexota bacterium]
MQRIVFLALVTIWIIVGCAPAQVEPTAEAVDEPITLEQNYSITLANGTLSIDYPEGWDINAEFPDLGMVIATTEDLAQQTSIEGNLEAEQVYIEILFAPESSLEQSNPAAVLQTILDEVGETEATVSEIEARTLNGKISAFVTIDFEERADGIQLVIDSGDAYTTLITAVADGQIETYLPVIEAIAGSIEYFTESEAEATEDVEVEVTAEATEE